MQDFRRLEVWREAHQHVLDVYRTTAGFPADERYGLTSQLRRAAVSVAANLAEGRSRPGDRDFARFVSVAFGSATETEYYLVLARDLGLLEPAVLATLEARTPPGETYVEQAAHCSDGA